MPEAKNNANSHPFNVDPARLETPRRYPPPPPQPYPQLIPDPYLDPNYRGPLSDYYTSLTYEEGDDDRVNDETYAECDDESRDDPGEHFDDDYSGDDSEDAEQPTSTESPGAFDLPPSPAIWGLAGVPSYPPSPAARGISAPSDFPTPLPGSVLAGASDVPAASKIPSPSALQDVIGASPSPAMSGPSSEPGPLDDIRPNGVVHQTLERSRKTLDTGDYQLHEQLCGNLRTMQAAIVNPAYLNRPKDVSLTILLRQIAMYDNHWYSIDPVLQFCVGRHWGIEYGACNVPSTALKQYKTKPDVYDRLLGDFIPADFRDEARSSAAAETFDEGTNDTAAEDWTTYRRRLQTRRDGQLLGLPTGLPSLDEAIRGLRGLMFLGGGPGVGKTALALFMALNALRKDPHLAVLFYSLDMSKTAMFDRILCQEAGITCADLMGGSSPYQSEIAEAEKRLRSQILPRIRIVDDLVAGDADVILGSICEAQVQLRRIQGITKVLTVVDYFQLLPLLFETNSPLDLDFQRVGLLQSLQSWTCTSEKPAGDPVLVISEVRKGDWSRNELAIGDLMGSARLGYSAGSILLLESPNTMQEYVEKVPVRVKVAKCRDGAGGTNIVLLFEHLLSRFKELRREAPQQGGKTSISPAVKPGLQKNSDPLAGLGG